MYIGFNIYIRTNIGLITIHQLFFQSLLFNNSQKNLYNFINYTKIRTDLMQQKIISCLNQVFFMINAN